MRLRSILMEAAAQQTRRILSDMQSGVRDSEIANRYGLSRARISQIRSSYFQQLLRPAVHTSTRQILGDMERGMRDSEIARKYGLSRVRVGVIRRKHLGKLLTPRPILPGR